MSQSVIVQSLWVEGELSAMERLVIASHLRQGHQFDLYTYGRVPNVPDGVRVLDARQILPEADGAWRYCQGHGAGSLAAGSNAFRYKLLHEKGGWWVDMDLVALRPFDFAQPAVIATEQLSSGWIPTTCCLKMPPGSPLMDRCLRSALAASRVNVAIGDLGPKLLGTAVRELGMESACVPPRVFWPNGTNRDVRVFLDRGTHFSSEDSYGIHLTHTRWRSSGLNTNGTYDVAGLFETLKRLYGLDRPIINQRILEVYLTEFCTRHCLNCCSGTSICPSSATVSMDTIRSVTESASGHPWHLFKLYGGEPTLHPQFLEIVNALRPIAPVVVLTNGATQKTRDLLGQLPVDVGVKNTAKDQPFCIPFEAMYVAPMDLERYQSCDFSAGCWRLHECGIGLSCRGEYFACGPGAAIDRVFRLGIGIKRIADLSEDSLRSQCSQMCRYCGLFRHPPVMAIGEQPMSHSWRQAIAMAAAAGQQPEGA